MACFYPLRAFQCLSGDVVFVERSRHDIVRSLWLSCGQCIGCRLERSRQWAVRCLHEASMHRRNCFITLTYDDEHAPADHSLNYRVFQLFMKRLRKRFPDDRIRFYMCGEYGDDFSRPHYHACIFGFDFADRLFWSRAASDSKLYRSAVLESLWPFGFSSVGEVTFESAAYVARYIMKKVTGDPSAKHYKSLIASTGEIVERMPEFTHMSLKPGIGAEYQSTYAADMYPHGMVVVRGKEARTPRYYDKKFEKSDPDGYAEMCLVREKFSAARVADNTEARLLVREVVLKSRVSSLVRKI